MAVVSLGALRFYPPSGRSIVVLGIVIFYCFVVIFNAGVKRSCPDLERLLKSPLFRDQESLQQLQLVRSRPSQHPVEVDDVRDQLKDDVTAAPAAMAVAAGVVQAPVYSGYSHSALLDPALAPATLHLVWCGRRWFEFHHYINVLSMLKHINPDLVIFHYDNLPVLDDWIYNTWFDDLKSEVPFLRLEKVTSQDGACTAAATPSVDFVAKKLSKHGGVYVNEHTFISQFPLHLRKETVVDGLDRKTMLGFILAQRGVLGNIDVRDLDHSAVKVKKLSCVERSKLGLLRQTFVCATSKKLFYPKDIWESRISWAKEVRTVFYGSPEVPKVRRSYDQLIPNIAHIVWIGGGEMDFLFYLCVLSLIYVAKVDVVYIHGDGPPSGPLWDELHSRERKIRLIYRETPRTIYGTEVKVVSHVTDIWRGDFMLKYGGIYVDTDTAFVRPLDRDIRSYEAVGSYDWTYWNHPFPDTINFGVAIGKRNATYWQHFQRSMKWFIDADWSWNGLRQPYRIKERHPELVKIDPRLQVICFQYKCHPTWHPKYHNESFHHLNTDSISDWRQQAYAFHWTLPTPPELKSRDALLAATGMFADIGRFILQEAGRL